VGLGQAWKGVSAKRSRRQALSEFKDAGGDVQPQVAAAKQFGHRAKFRLRQERRAMALDKLPFGQFVRRFVLPAGFSDPILAFEEGPDGAVVIAAQPGKLPMHFAESCPAFFGVGLFFQQWTNSLPCTPFSMRRPRSSRMAFGSRAIFPMRVALIFSRNCTAMLYIL
jgi:hypothetical protein